MPEINYLAVLVAAIGFMVVGAIWYGPLFGRLWMQGMGWDPNDEALKAKMKKTAGPAYFQMFIGALIASYVLAHVIWAYSVALPDVTGIAAGLQAGFWIWLGFQLPLKYGDKLWAGKPLKFVAIDLGYQLVALLLAGVIIASWA